MGVREREGERVGGRVGREGGRMGGWERVGGMRVEGVGGWAEILSLHIIQNLTPIYFREQRRCYGLQHACQVLAP